MNDSSYEPIQAIVELNTALVEAQGAMSNIHKGTEVDTGTFKYSYAPLDVIVATVRPVLADHGLAVVQLLEPGPALRTELRHKGGGVLGSSFPFAAPENPKALGSMLTYIRRYALMAILNLATADDDGAAADDAPIAKPEPMITKGQHVRIAELVKVLNEKAPPTEGQLSWVEQVRAGAGVKSRSEMTHDMAAQAIRFLEEQIEAAGIPF